MTWVLNVAIYLRAALTIIKNLLVKYGLMAFDFIVVGMVLFGFSRIWATFYFNDPRYYHESPMIVNVLLYSGIWVITLFLAGAYDKPFDWKRLVKGWIFGWVIVAVLYGFFAAPLRSSRIMVLAGGVLSIAVYVFIRSLFSHTLRGRWLFARPGLLRFIIVGDGSEAARIQDLIQSNRPSYQFQGVVSPIAKSPNSSIGTIDQLDQISRFHQIDEIIFCSKNVASSEIMKWMTKLGDQISYKIAPDQSTSIIGSKSKNDPGELYTVEVNYQIDDPTLRRNKRILDLFLALTLLIVWPLVIGLVERRSRMHRIEGGQAKA